MPAARFTKLTIGLAGGIASGKTAASDWFAAQGIKVVDTDVIAREVVAVGSPVLADIAALFGDEVLLPNGELNRPFLRQLIFSDYNAKRQLEQLTHPAIRERTLEQLSVPSNHVLPYQTLAPSQLSAPYQILVSALLFETQQQTLCDHTLLIYVDQATQLQRLMSRDQSSLQQAKAMIASQMPFTEKLNLADTAINNQGSLDQLYNALANFHQLHSRA